MRTDTQSLQKDNQNERRDEASETAVDEAQQRGREVAEQTHQEASQLVEDAQQAASEGAAQAKQQAATVLQRQKANTADHIASVGEAVEAAAKTLHEDDKGGVAEYVDGAAKQLSKASDYLRNREFTELANDVQGFARRRPELFYGGLFVAGIAMSRFLKASSERERSSANHGVSASQTHDLPPRQT